MNKYLIDTDIGDDIDDAFALLHAMELGLDIVGITTVFKNTVERAKITKKLTNLYKNGYESTPVYAGHGQPLAVKVDTGSHLCQYTDDVDGYTPDSECADEAIDFIISSCKKYGRELYILALGPFTNLAKVIERDPEVLKSIGGIILMGGAYFRQYADWNISCDPEAAAILYDAIPDMHCIGADVTHVLRISEEDDKIIADYCGRCAAKRYVSELYRLWKEEHGGKRGVLHDPLVIRYAVEPSVCECVTAPVKVITEGYARGISLNLSAYTKAYMNPYLSGVDATDHTLAKTVDRDAVISKFVFHFKE